MTASMSLRFCAPARTQLRAAQPPARRQQLRVVAETRWSLTPSKAWAIKNEAAAKKLKDVELTKTIGTTEYTCTVGDKGDADQSLGSTTGVHVQFESKGEASPNDSPASLFLKDLGSEVEVKVDSEVAEKGKEYPLKPGTKISFGPDAVFEVERDVRAAA